MRDTLDTIDFRQRIDALRERLIDAGAGKHLAELDREARRARGTRLRTAQAAQSLAGMHGSQDDLAAAIENERAHERNLRNARREIGRSADAAVPEMRALAEQLAGDAAALAELLRAIGEHVANHGGRPSPTAEIWPGAWASARGLTVVAGQLGGKP